MVLILNRKTKMGLIFLVLDPPSSHACPHGGKDIKNCLGKRHAEVRLSNKHITNNYFVFTPDLVDMSTAAAEIGARDFPSKM